MNKLFHAEALEHRIWVFTRDHEVLWEANLPYGANLLTLREARAFAQQLTELSNTALKAGASMEDVKGMVKARVAERESSRAVRTPG